MDPKSKRIGGLPGLPAEGEDARSVGKADQNETITGAERTPQGNNIPETDGPDIDPNGAYRPARYPISHEIETKNGTMKTISMIREDR